MRPSLVRVPLRFPIPTLIGIAALGCSAPQPKPEEPDLKSISGMVRIPGGQFTMGSDTSGRPDEGPAHKVTLDPFYMDIHEVTNDEFAKFVTETHYKTVAERPLDPKEFPGVPKSKLVPGGLVFITGSGWHYEPGASWQHPTGPESNLNGLGSHPVVQVAWEDARAYAKWAGKDLPTEAQWEYAAHGGVYGSPYLWGEADPETDAPRANIWQGEWPIKNRVADGYKATSPAESFKPNGYGLYDMAGNVWEWCADWYRPDAYALAEPINPQGPASSMDPDEPELAKKVLRGGSFLCAKNYCQGYRPTARMKSSPDTGLMHTGFRCVINIKEQTK